MCRARRAMRSGSASRRRTTRSGPGARRISPPRQRRARRTCRRRSRSASGPRRSPIPPSWIQTAEAIKACRPNGKRSARCRAARKRPIWERFRAACDRFFTRRHDDLAKRKAVWAENFGKKEALCAQVEALAESTDWERDGRRDQTPAGGVEDHRPSQEEPIGGDLAAVPRRLRSVLRPLRAAARYCARRTGGRARSDLRGARGACFGPSVRCFRRRSETPAELLGQGRDSLRARWQQEIAARGVEPARAAALDQRFAAAFERLRDSPARGIRRHRPRSRRESPADGSARRACRRARGIASAGPSSTDDAALSPTTRLAAMLKEALASNTIGGKVDEDSRARAAQEDVRQAQASWSRIGPVPEPCAAHVDGSLPAGVPRIADAGVGVGAGPGAGVTGGTGRTGGTSKAGAPGGAGRAPSGARN